MQMVCDEAAAWTDAGDAARKRGSERVHAHVWTATQRTKKGKKNGFGLCVCARLPVLAAGACAGVV